MRRIGHRGCHLGIVGAFASEATRADPSVSFRLLIKKTLKSRIVLKNVYITKK
jgi:hypothetical protein